MIKRSSVKTNKVKVPRIQNVKSKYSIHNEMSRNKLRVTRLDYRTTESNINSQSHFANYLTNNRNSCSGVERIKFQKNSALSKRQIPDSMLKECAKLSLKILEMIEKTNRYPKERLKSPKLARSSKTNLNTKPERRILEIDLPSRPQNYRKAINIHQTDTNQKTKEITDK